MRKLSRWRDLNRARSTPARISPHSLGFLARGLGRPRRPVVPNGDPTLSAVDPGFQEVNLSGPLSTNSKALYVGIPSHLSFFQNIDDSLGDSLRSGHSPLNQTVQP
jgi:hypothetical protein